MGMQAGFLESWNVSQVISSLLPILSAADPVSHHRKAAIASHPPAMHRLGIAEMNGEIGLTKRPREGVRWIKRAAELADQVDPPQPQSLHELAMLNEKGIDNIIFVVSRSVRILHRAIADGLE